MKVDGEKKQTQTDEVGVLNSTPSIWIGGGKKLTCRGENWRGGGGDEGSVDGVELLMEEMEG